MKKIDYPKRICLAHTPFWMFLLLLKELIIFLFFDGPSDFHQTMGIL